jgi:hypothetical protein
VVAIFLSGHARSVPECVKQVKARIKCEDADVAANSICLLDALVIGTTAPFRLQVVETVVGRLAKMATQKFNYPPPVALCARTVLIKWAETFPQCKEFADAAKTLRSSTSAPQAAPRHNAAPVEEDEEVAIPSAQPRDTSTVPSRPAATGILMDARAAAALTRAPAPADPLNSRFCE